jgi:hypothetical protein
MLMALFQLPTATPKCFSRLVIDKEQWDAGFLSLGQDGKPRYILAIEDKDDGPVLHCCEVTNCPVVLLSFLH